MTPQETKELLDKITLCCDFTDEYGGIMNISLNEISKIIEELKLITNMVSLMPDKEVSIALEPEDKRKIGGMDISCELLCIKESVTDTLNMNSDTIDDIYKNAVDEREGYPEDSMTKRVCGWMRYRILQP